MATVPDSGKGILRKADDSVIEHVTTLGSLVAPPTAGSPNAIQPDPHETQHQAVRFSSVNQEFEPLEHLKIRSISTGGTEPEAPGPALSPEAQRELRQLSHQMSNQRLQGRRMCNFAYEPVSLPVSRLPSNESIPSQAGSRGRTTWAARSPRQSPLVRPSQTSPLRSSTPIDSQHRSGDVTGDLLAVAGSPGRMVLSEALISPRSSSRPPSSDAYNSTRPTSISTGPSTTSSHSKHGPPFSTGGVGGSLPTTREPSPSGTPVTGSGTSTPSSRPFTPGPDQNDPYARHKRQDLRVRKADEVDARFKFSGYRRSSGQLTGLIPRISSAGSDKREKEEDKEKRQSHSFLGLGKRVAHHDEAPSTAGSQQSSMTNLKRFFKIGGHKKSRRDGSHGPTTPTESRKSISDGSNRVPGRQVPFADDHGLEKRYGKFGKVLGSGAGGSVRVIRRTTDGVLFAVKEFRPRRPDESEKDYKKKVTAEYCLGSTFHHGNLIETMDLVQEKGKWFEVMEFAPFDLFQGVMTGRMTKQEIVCTFVQICNGVKYLHAMGVAHRDLKLDNVVVNMHGIMKIIDFGSATVFRYPFESGTTRVRNIVGSDPYLAPEVYQRDYEPAPPDIWSLAIIFACMTLRRFPWKQPTKEDNSYRLFAATPSPEVPSNRPALESTSTSINTNVPGSSDRKDVPSHPTSEKSPPPPHHHHRHHPTDTSSPPASTTASKTVSSKTPKPTNPIQGPQRLLRLLPEPSRHIIGRMLIINPAKRATMEEIYSDPWVLRAAVCGQGLDGTVYLSEGHEHTLVEGASPEKPKDEGQQ